MTNLSKLAALGLSLTLALTPIISQADTLRYRYSVSGDGAATGPSDGPATPTPPTDPGQVAEDGWIYYNELTEWQPVGEPFGCSEWLPNAATIPSGVSFQQIASGCSQNIERYNQRWKENSSTMEDVWVENLSTESKTMSGLNLTQNAVGTNAAFSVYVYGNTDGQVQKSVGLQWNSNGATSYQIKGSADGSGVSSSYVDMGTEEYTYIVPTAGGKYTYTILATNASGETATGSIQVDVLDFEIKNFKIEESEVTAGADLHLSWEPIAGAKMEIFGEGDVTGLSSTVMKANTRSGSNLYILSATKTIDGKERDASAYAYYEVIGAPYMRATNYPKLNEVYGRARSSFNIMWTSDNAVRYTIKSNDAASGVSTTPIEISGTGGSSSSYQVMPNELGKYVYTVTGYNKFGASTDLVVPVTVVEPPAIISFSADKHYASPGENVTLNWNVIGSTNTYIYGLGPVNGNSLTTSVGDNPGTKSWTLSANANANNQSWGTSLGTSVTVVANPTLTLTQVPTAPVQAGQPFTISWTATDFGYVTQVGSADESGWPKTAQPQDGYASSYSITPTAPGTYSYSVTITNRAGKSVVKGFLVEVQ